MAEICAESGTLVISDEIHADLTLPGRRHTVFATVSEKARNNSVTYMAASKAFNVPGLASSYLICQNPALLEKYQNFVNGREMGGRPRFCVCGAHQRLYGAGRRGMAAPGAGLHSGKHLLP